MRKLISRIRFLPLTIFAATLMLTVRVGDIWEGVDRLLDGTINVSQARAQANPNTPPTDAAASKEAAALPAVEAPAGQK
ncbi:MAG: hypothetical protein NWR87_01075, partial [Rhodospirillales bacterium]|nr:hypothetical protein [Rhodospirillales bacterium]